MQSITHGPQQALCPLRTRGALGRPHRLGLAGPQRSGDRLHRETLHEIVVVLTAAFLGRPQQRAKQLGVERVAQNFPRARDRSHDSYAGPPARAAAYSSRYRSRPAQPSEMVRAISFTASACGMVPPFGRAINCLT